MCLGRELPAPGSFQARCRETAARPFYLFTLLGAVFAGLAAAAAAAPARAALGVVGLCLGFGLLFGLLRARL